jgi:hypothetical protein
VWTGKVPAAAAARKAQVPQVIFAPKKRTRVLQNTVGANNSIIIGLLTSPEFRILFFTV